MKDLIRLCQRGSASLTIPADKVITIVEDMIVVASSAVAAPQQESGGTNKPLLNQNCRCCWHRNQAQERRAQQFED